MHPFRAAVEARDLDAVVATLSEQVMFHSPIVFAPYVGKHDTAAVLAAALAVFEDFSYEAELSSDDGGRHALIFRARVGARELQGCDFLHHDRDGLVDDLTVMVRPLSAALALRDGMAARLGARPDASLEIVDERRAMVIALPGESPEYRSARNRLLEREIELRREMEAVAAARRELPPGGEVREDYVFDAAGRDGAPTDRRLSELFAPGKDSLLIYNFMFPRDPSDDTPGPDVGETGKLPLAQRPCPSCTAFLDQLDGAAEHVNQHVNFVIVAKAPLARVLAFARERGWRRLRLLSSARNTYNVDYLAETAEGLQRPMLTVFHRDGDVIRHFWSSEMLYAPSDPGQHPRHVGTLEPLWNLFDLTPEGRPDWAEQFSYAEALT